jgi:hypothetical protein
VLLTPDFPRCLTGVRTGKPLRGQYEASPAARGFNGNLWMQGLDAWPGCSAGSGRHAGPGAEDAAGQAGQVQENPLPAAPLATQARS